MKVVNSHSSNRSKEVQKRYILRMRGGLTSQAPLGEEGMRRLIEIVESQTAMTDVKCTFEFNEPDAAGNTYVDVVMDGNRYSGDDASGGGSGSIDSQGRDRNE